MQFENASQEYNVSDKIIYFTQIFLVCPQVKLNSQFHSLAILVCSIENMTFQLEVISRDHRLDSWEGGRFGPMALYQKKFSQLGSV